jgi:hypothetical protein
MILAKDQRAGRDIAHEFAKNELAPQAAKWDSDRTLIARSL